jgi:hypothetical protein
VEAIDSVGLSSITSYSFTVDAFEAPIFTDYPERLTPGVIPALRGTTRPRAHVVAEFSEGDRIYGTYEVVCSDEGHFTLIPDSAFPVGVYSVRAYAIDEYGAQSERTHDIRMIVEDPGYIRVGSFMVTVLSVIVPLIALGVILIFGTSVLLMRLKRWRREVMKETLDAEEKLKIEFDALITSVHSKVVDIKEARKGKLTKAELSQFEEIETDLRQAQLRLKKELADIEHIVE